jgi:hypothetical protein
MKPILLGAILAGLLAGISPGNAQTNFAIFKVTAYYQASVAPPTAPNTPNAYYFGAQFGTADDSAIENVGLVDPAGDNISLTESAPDYFSFGSPFFADKADFDAAYGSGAYDFYVNYTNSTDYGSVTVPAQDFYTTNIAAFTTNCWTGMQQVDPARCFNLQWNAFTPDTNTTGAYTFINVQDNVSGDTPYSANYLTPDTTTTNIPAGTLLYGRTYTVSLFFSDRQDFPNAGFGGALGTIGFDHVTQTTLAAIPPWLQISADPTNVTLPWPALATNFVLTSTCQLSADSVWFTVTNQPSTLGCTNSLVLPHTAPSQFFRLSGF